MALLLITQAQFSPADMELDKVIPSFEHCAFSSSSTKEDSYSGAEGLFR